MLWQSDSENNVPNKLKVRAPLGNYKKKKTWKKNDIVPD